MLGAQLEVLAIVLRIDPMYEYSKKNPTWKKVECGSILLSLTVIHGCGDVSTHGDEAYSLLLQTMKTVSNHVRLYKIKPIPCICHPSSSIRYLVSSFLCLSFISSEDSLANLETILPFSEVYASN